MLKIKQIAMLVLIFFATNGWTCDFDCTLEKHLQSIQKRDFTGFETTLTSGEQLTFILPNGKRFNKTSDFKAMLKEWFETPGWTFTPQTLVKQQSPEMGVALLLVDYREADRDGKPYQLSHYLSLVFKKEQGRWGLVHDQNTIAFPEIPDSSHDNQQQ